MNKRLLTLLFIFSIFACKLIADPVSWKISLVDKGNGEIELVAAASIEAGWHLYDTQIPDGGPYPTSISIDDVKGATPVGSFNASNSKLIKEFDKVFEMQVGYYDRSATFVQRFKITDKSKFVLKGDVRAQACNDRECTPPIPIDFAFSAKDLPTTVTVSAENKDVATPTEDTIATTAIDSTTAITNTSAENTDLWTPVINEVKAFGAVGDLSNKSVLGILFWGFIGGLLALITPCVWPIIPMTVSFFLKRNKANKNKAIKEAITYGLAIILIYLTLGLLITGLFGAGALNKLSTNLFFNLFLFILLLVFAASFFGAFEIVLPASWTSKIDSKADSTSGFISIFFMAFTLVLVSFSCTGPIIGTLLVEAASSGSIVAPALGMFAFALALAIPFALFAIFPSWLEGMPKSGGWLNSVKVILGFLEIALALKFLSIADMTNKWGILDREVFLVLWIVIFALLGMYLLGKIKFSHDSGSKYVSVPRVFLAILSLSFAMYMIPGLWGAPLKAISAFAPLPKTQDFSLYDGDVHAKFEDYEEGMEYARKNNKPVIVDFSGFGCVNCRKMEAAVWTDPRVKNILDNDYVLITLMVDDKEKLPQIIEKEENGKTSKLKTIGDKWSYLQRHKFGTNSQPYYVLLDASGNPIGPSYAYDENIDKYLTFLKTGLDNFKK
ncbi:MAG: hypothetical protein RL662_2541 [Bacteroidota bacterium]|jgi:thiol:disulfide interchange protein DsbD